MTFNRSTKLSFLTAALAGATLLAIPAVAQKGAPDDPNRPSIAPNGTGGGPADTFGHVIFDGSTPNCAVQMVDISGTGTPLTFTASATFPADDDGGAEVTLQEPFSFYGTSYTSVVVSTNGYITMGATLATESGGDFSEDCPLPAMPDNPPAANARIMPFHNDLDGDGPGGTVYVEYFAACPRASEAGAESCTIVLWDGWSIFGGAGTYDLQAVLYHQSGLINYTYDDPTGLLDPNTGAVAIQNELADDAAVYVCAAPATIDQNAVCIYDPACVEPGCLGGGGEGIPTEVDVAIPTASTVGLGALAALLALAGLWVVRRR
ncbi:MAG: hypothetical protein AAF725_15850 [Acidobacteriota bacterium]